MNNSHANTIVKIIAAPAIVFFAHIILDQVFHVYGLIRWLDTPMHFIGGTAIALSAHVFIRAVQEEHAEPPMHWQLRILFIVSLVGLAAIFWEFAEFAGDTFIFHAHYFQPNVGDVMKDLFMGLLGGTITGFIVTKK